MNDNTVTLNQTENKFSVSGDKRTRFEMSRREWGMTIAFLLSLSLTGLLFPLGYLFLAIILVNRFIKDRTDFLIQYLLLVSCSGFVGENAFPFKLTDTALAFSVIGLIVYRKTPLIKKITWLVVAYIAAIFFIAMHSEETMSIQLRTMRGYFFIIAYFIPLLFLADHDFNLKYFCRRLIGYSLVICAFYIIDGFILNGWVLLPSTFIWSDDPVFSTFYDLRWNPFSTYFPRKWPSSAYPLIMCIYPLCRFYKISKWQWAIIIVSMIAMRTMTLVAAFFVTYIFFIGRGKQFIKYTLIGLIALPVLYFVDNSTGRFMRIASTIDQFTSLEAAADIETASEFGSGRFAQAIPKFELWNELGCQMWGLGFLHSELTTNPKFWVWNEFYSDQSEKNASEVATGVEVTQLQTLLEAGIIGLVVQCAFYVMLYLMVRKLKYSSYFLSMLVGMSIFGLGGFGGLIWAYSLTLVAGCLGVVILANRDQSFKSDYANEQ